MKEFKKAYLEFNENTTVDNTKSYSALYYEPKNS